MFLHVSVEREWLYDDLLVYLRGIEQMKCSSLPYGDADMRGVQSLLVGDDDDNVAVADDTAQQAMVVELGFGDVLHLSARDALFHSDDAGQPFPMAVEHGIG